MQKIRTGDDVVVISGSNKGARGKVEKVVFDSNHNVSHVVVEGANMRTKHSKPNPNKGDPGGIVKKEAPIHVSNVALYNEEKGGPDKVKIKTSENGERIRAYASGGNVT